MTEDHSLSRTERQIFGELDVFSSIMAEVWINLISNFLSPNMTVEFGGNEICSPTFTENCAEQIKLIIEANEFGIFHATSEGSASWFEFGEEIIRQSSSTTSLVKRKYKETAPAIIRPKYTVLENRHLNDLGINIMLDWKKALSEYLSRRRKMDE